MLDFLRAVANDVDSTYRNAADRVLLLSPDMITDRDGGIVRGDESGTAAINATRQVAAHFAEEQFEGSTKVFLVIDTEVKGWDHPAVLFFNRDRQALEPDPAAPEMRAINVACAPYLVYIRARTELDPRAMGIDRDPRTCLIVKPVLDEHKRIIAVAGMIIDPIYFDNRVLLPAIDNHLPEFFPTEYKDVLISITNEVGEPVWGDDQVSYKTAEARTRFGLVYQRAFLVNRMRHETEEQWAHRFFVNNAAIWGVMAVLLVGGLVLTLRAASRAMKLSEMKSDFVSNVSHELRTPLASIRVFGEFFKLGRVKDTEKVREYGEYIETESRRLTQLINNILDFSKIESGQKAYTFEQADLMELASETLKVFEVRLKQADFVLSFEAPTGLPPVNIDHEAITQALVNLLDNAVKYSGDSREITVRLGQKEKWVTVSIIDRGIGIPTEEHEKIFERFHRVGKGLVHDVRGSGLGLAIVKHIVDEHRGKLTVDSKPGRGSTFTIWLPAVDNPAHGDRRRTEVSRGVLSSES